jgi:two-component system NtrC family response regulator
MVAMAIHRRSRRAARPFVAINCNAIPENLIESELFGHEKGAFTGASSQRLGLIETAAGGTLFLDELGDLPAPLQVKLLRFLQENRIQRVGGRCEISVDVRVLAATHVDLTEAIAAGRFREDLFFRLAVVLCKLPPLRQRGADIPLLATEFLHQLGAANGRQGLSFTPDALDAIVRYRWPGNVRELQNRVHRAVIMADGPRISPAELELPVARDPQPAPLRQARAHLERDLLVATLHHHHHNISAAARSLGISRPSLYELMARHGVANIRG